MEEEELIDEELEDEYEFEHPSIADYNGFISFGTQLY
jgi:hypothetical protein